MPDHMYVITHMEKIQNLPNDFEILYVGAQGKTVPSGMIGDDTGENISCKNLDYCELTGIYWAWKNSVYSDADYVGFCHYRRFYGSKNHSMNPKDYLSAKNIRVLLGNKKIIVTRKIHYIDSVYDTLVELPSKEDVNKLRKALLVTSPEYIDVYEKYFQNNMSWHYNMFVMCGKDFKAFCEWMFPILEKCEEFFPQKGQDGYIPRMYGYLSEHLMCVWMMRNIDEDDILELPMILTKMGRVKGYIESYIRPIKDMIRNMLYEKKYRKKLSV